MNNCKIIEDLLPSYCDGLTSEKTNALILNHVESCPNCARLLEQMSAEPPRESIDHWEQFRRRMKECEQKHRMKVLCIVVACMIVLSVILVVWVNSYGLSLWIADLKMEAEVSNVSELVFRSETESRYIYYTLHGPNLVTLAKNDTFGFWYIAAIDNSPSHVWFEESNYRWFKGTEFIIDFEFHYLYIGSGAKAFIDLDSADIPGDVLVEVNQKGRNYWIHVVSDNTDAVNQLNLMQKLRDKGFIE